MWQTLEYPINFLYRSCIPVQTLLHVCIHSKCYQSASVHLNFVTHQSDMTGLESSTVQCLTIIQYAYYKSEVRWEGLEIERSAQLNAYSGCPTSSTKLEYSFVFSTFFDSFEAILTNLLQHLSQLIMLCSSVERPVLFDR